MGHGVCTTALLPAFAAPEQPFVHGLLRAPFQLRPVDMLLFVATYRSYSKYITDALAARNQTVWRNSASLTANYSMRVSQGNYLTLALGYVRGAAITPRVPVALTFTVNWGLYS